jgi:hypothetical protein
MSEFNFNGSSFMYNGGRLTFTRGGNGLSIMVDCDDLSEADLYVDNFRYPSMGPHVTLTFPQRSAELEKTRYYASINKADAEEVTREFHALVCAIKGITLPPTRAPKPTPKEPVSAVYLLSFAALVVVPLIVFSKR